MSKLKEITEMNALDKVQSELIFKLTDFSRYIASKKFTNNEVRRKAKDILLSFEEVGGFYEELMK